MLSAAALLLRNWWSVIFAGLAGGAIVRATCPSPVSQVVKDAERLEPIGFQPGEGQWQVRLHERGPAVFMLVLSRSFGIEKLEALRMTGDLPAVLVSDATQEHAEELVDRLRQIGAIAEPVPPSAWT
ncbi:hypothetical protein Ate02nite_36280 [Paractinoplanes tereljensis]|uniref:Ribosomal protein L7/L12 C-terminal domain-containing protein n=1 Tax=Paractinoplanes tereljensis TaxID=571912 RepID=A0A919TS12_9ACTN|nr:hypothetical protein Ate02nite_36280 [Actinoplanes tereljensis]